MRAVLLAVPSRSEVVVLRVCPELLPFQTDLASMKEIANEVFIPRAPPGGAGRA
jgi:hypothetical protein